MYVVGSQIHYSSLPPFKLSEPGEHDVKKHVHCSTVVLFIMLWKALTRLILKRIEKNWGEYGETNLTLGGHRMLYK